MRIYLFRSGAATQLGSKFQGNLVSVCRRLLAFLFTWVLNPLAAPRTILGVSMAIPGAKTRVQAVQVGVQPFKTKGLTPFLVLSNDQPEPVFELGLANSFNRLQGDWIEISPYGQFQHYTGNLQVVDRTAAEAMVEHFNSLRGRMARRFGGLPIYIGHPDDPDRQDQYRDDKAYGWIEELRAGESGFDGRVKWSNAGKDLVDNGHYKFYSPRWGLNPAAGVKLGFRPIILQSLGLTNTPVIPVKLLANAKPPGGGEERPENENQNIMQKEKIIAFLNKNGCTLSNTATDPEIEAALNQLGEKAGKVVSLENSKQTADTALQTEKTARSTAEQALTLANTAKATAETNLKTERKARVDLILSNAVKEGKITVAEKPAWATKFEANFDGTVTELSNAIKKVKTAPITVDHRRVEPSRTVKAASDKIVAAARSLSNSSKIPYTQAFNQLKDEKPELFQALTEAESASEGAQE